MYFEMLFHEASHPLMPYSLVWQQLLRHKLPAPESHSWVSPSEELWLCKHSGVDLDCPNPPHACCGLYLPQLISSRQHANNIHDLA